MMVMVYGFDLSILYFYCAYVCKRHNIFFFSWIRAMNKGEHRIVIRFAFIYHNFMFGCGEKRQF